jgi:hypothetical protein
MPKFILLFSILLLSACAVTPRGSESYYFDCDTPAGDFSEWNRTIAGTSFRITGSIELRSPRDDTRWQPTGSVWFIRTDSQKIGLQGIKEVRDDVREYRDGYTPDRSAS